VGANIPPGASRSPGLGLGWTRTASAVAAEIPPDEVGGIWLFPPVRREEREWGIAVVSRRADSERCRIYTASYMLVVRGRDRGQSKIVVEEVGEGPRGVVPELIKGVQQRAGESEPPIEVSAELWFPPNEREPVQPADSGGGSPRLMWQGGDWEEHPGQGIGQ
jgi:hypothetical protein